MLEECAEEVCGMNSAPPFIATELFRRDVAIVLRIKAASKKASKHLRDVVRYEEAAAVICDLRVPFALIKFTDPTASPSARGVKQAAGCIHTILHHSSQGLSACNQDLCLVAIFTDTLVLS